MDEIMKLEIKNWTVERAVIGDKCAGPLWLNYNGTPGYGPCRVIQGCVYDHCEPKRVVYDFPELVPKYVKDALNWAAERGILS